MILIAESGSTKTDWRLVHKNNEISSYTTMGLNPYYITEAIVLEELDNSLSTLKSAITEVYFYGAGCSSNENCLMMLSIFSLFFKNANIEVASDMMAAARATCGNEEGMVAILGTGSNSCFYDGKEIAENVTSLGYILGDYGSGADIGKQLITDFLEKELPQDLVDEFKKEFDLTPQDIINAIYKKPFPNRFLASFNLFVTAHISHPYIIDLVKNRIKLFLEKNVYKYSDYQKNKLNLVGSISAIYESIIRAEAEQKNITIGKIIKAPIDELVAYHLN
ncbi:MAG: hypothetical protein P8Q14_05135 [Vicingaceae bacterium]|nr:hypothetical protein [Vicingaceae bacterium]